MGEFTFRRAVRENVPLIIGMVGGTGSGKTLSAMLLARGMSGGKEFAVIDTENGRAKHYAPAPGEKAGPKTFDFFHGELSAPFRPQAYLDAIVAFDKAGYPVIVVDSMSHVWAGDGGILDWQEEEWAAKGHAESHKMLAWVKPKMAHKQMVQRLLQLRAHLILCFRAEEKVEMRNEKKELLADIKRTESALADARPSETDELKKDLAELRAKLPNADSRTQIVPKRSGTGINGWVPICEKTLPYELTASFLVMADNPGIPLPIKLQAQHRDVIDLSKPLNEDAGRKLAQWATGTGAKTEGKPPQPAPTAGPAVTAAAPSTYPSTPSDASKQTASQPGASAGVTAVPPGATEQPPALATPRQVNDLLDLIEVKAVPRKTLDLWLKGGTWETMRHDRIQWCIDALKKMADK